jgi:hypothetical protein
MVYPEKERALFLYAFRTCPDYMLELALRRQKRDNIHFLPCWDYFSLLYGTSLPGHTRSTIFPL